MDSSSFCVLAGQLVEFRSMFLLGIGRGTSNGRDFGQTGRKSALERTRGGGLGRV